MANNGKAIDWERPVLMLPSVLACQTQQGVKDFLKTTFPISTSFFHGALDRLLENDEQGIFKGPYVSINLPFKKGDGRKAFFPDVPLSFDPHYHQELAFKRLAGPNPKSTIVATGTGSGKTESFLVPILDHCYQNRNKKGIKAILIYPMNALASDQAGRLAKMIWENPKLQGNVSAGLFVGASESDPRKVMAEDGIVTNKDTLRKNPPDILLTNYKMLDYLLIRPKDRVLWDKNDPETLRYLVVDELHTFDGAQGTDLACLIRRLKMRLAVPESFLCCVGTSATLGGDDAGEKLVSYSETVFGEQIKSDAIVTESRLTAGEYLADEDASVEYLDVPGVENLSKLDSIEFESYEDYINTQVKLWLPDDLGVGDLADAKNKVLLGKGLKKHGFFQNVLRSLTGKPKTLSQVISDLKKRTRGVNSDDPHYWSLLLDSLLSLVSESRVWSDEALPESERKARPFLEVRVQLWLRELRRLVCELNEEPSFKFSDDLNEDQRKFHLPSVHCRECGTLGWGIVYRTADRKVQSNLQNFYSRWFGRHPDVKVVYPIHKDELESVKFDKDRYRICRACLYMGTNFESESCVDCGESDWLEVLMPPNSVNSRGKTLSTHNCTHCGAYNGLTIVGSRAASLTSVMIAQLFGSKYNDDKKLLTFSDSVQDAAHRAGFFAARTYSFNLRAAIQQFVQDYLGENGATLGLKDAPNEFVKHCRKSRSDEEFVATFLAPNLAWFEDYDHLKEKGSIPQGSNLIDDVSKRLKWDFIAEFGFTSRVGRTLEKSLASVAGLKNGVLDEVLDRLLERLQNEIGELRDLDRDTLEIFLIGFLAHLKVTGGMADSGLDRYMESMGDYFQLRFRRNWMPNIGKFARIPVFLYQGGRSRTFQKLHAPKGSARTWSMFWAEKVFMGVHLAVAARIPEILENCVAALVDGGVLRQIESRDAKVWGLKADVFEISLNPHQIRCDQCHHLHFVSESELPVWLDGPCLRGQCSGKYQKDEPESSYYRKLYSTGDIQRIFAAEHTGLLDRDERENLEKEFKSANPKPWSPNLLSSTPTLEMGIDIGDLSSLILCSVPPAQANYLQRIGRAGRRDGNSLNLTIANARPHDLYFFAEPAEMIAGKVESPGVFLDASEVLKRQYLAFCFDHWASSGVEASSIPFKLIKALNVVEATDTTKFPYNFLDYISQHQTDILEKFKEMFGGDLSTEALERIEKFAGDSENDPIPYDILTRLQGMVRERDSLKSKLQSTTRLLRDKEKQKIKDQNYEKELEDLRQEKDALHKLIKKIDSKDTLQFFTDEGLLPNYAFPEAGVILKSVIFRKRRNPQPGEGNYESKVYEYERASASAIRELAPLNEFYAGGRHVEIDRVDLAVSDIEEWRLCQSCSYSEQIALGDDKPVCPRCKDDMWRDEGQKQSLIRMRQVFANRLDRDSRISDDADQRDPKFYNEQILVDFDSRDVISAYKIDEGDMAFGYEFVRRIKLKEVNFGEPTGFAQERRFAGVSMERAGFTICKGCGAVKKPNGEMNHAYICNQKKKSQDEIETQCVYLYREFDSEAMRLLLPATSVALDEKTLQSFIAGIHLGLKLKFGGNIQHLESTVQQSPIEGTNYSKKLLVIYDRIPGGTGYLKQLTKDPNALMEVFELALNHLKSCSCATDSELDGCYRCIYAYRHSHRMADTSRNEAILLFSKILKEKDKIETTKSIDDVDISSLLDSELEVRFIKSLERIRVIDGPKSVKHHIVNGKPGWLLTIGEKDKKQEYTVEPQVLVGEEQGVSVRSKVDFIIRPVRSSSQMKPIAVFTDGLTYHRDRIDKDTAQRMALLHSGRFHVWSIPWWDVESVYSEQKDYCTNYLQPSRAKLGANLGKFISGFEAPVELNGIHEKTSLQMLMMYLANPDEAGWRRIAGIYAAIHCDKEEFSSGENRSRLFELLESLHPNKFSSAITTIAEGMWGVLKDENSIPEMLALSKFVAIEVAGFTRPLAEDCVRVCLHINDTEEAIGADRFRNVWAGFLKQMNLFQFLPHFYFTSTSGMEGDVYLPIAPSFSGERTSADSGKVDHDLSEIADLVSEEVIEVVQKAIEFGAEVPEVGFEFVNDRGVVVGEAELAWPGKKKALLSESDWDAVNRLKLNDWKLAKLEDVMSDPAIIKDWF